jgi:hypothetical protein
MENFQWDLLATFQCALGRFSTTMGVVVFTDDQAGAVLAQGETDLLGRFLASRDERRGYQKGCHDRRENAVK